MSGKKSKFSEWRSRANNLQKNILNNKEAIDWWNNNYKAVYDINIEYPVVDPMPLCECTDHRLEYIKSCGFDLIKSVEKGKLFVDTLVDIYWYNINKEEYPCSLEIVLSPLQLKIIKARFIDGLSTEQTCELIGEGFNDNAMYQLLHRIKRRIIKYINNSKLNNIK